MKREDIEADLIETLIAWKKEVDALARTTAAARYAVSQAKELEIWAPKYSSFKEWLAEECDITESWAYALINTTKVIKEIEEAAGSSKKLGALVQKKNVAVLRALSDGAVSKLKGLPPVRAAKAALNAIEKAEGEIPSVKDVAAEVAKLQPKRAQAVPFEDHPVLIALDNEWVSIERDMAMYELKPKAMFKRLKAAVERVL